MSKVFFWLVLSVAGLPVSFQSTQAETGEALAAERLFQTCVVCHGARGEGLQDKAAPAIAGLPAWYTERQLNNFLLSIRSGHPQILSRTGSVESEGPANDMAVRGIAVYLESLQPAEISRLSSEGSALLLGDIDSGKKIYREVCLSCHGSRAQGVEKLGAPILTLQPLWYLQEQMQNFRTSVRGADKRDKFGMQMAAMAQYIEGDQALLDVLAYVDTL